MKHIGNLIVTVENQNNFKNLKEVSGYIYVSENATLTAPALTSSGYIYVSKNATLTAPALTKVSGYIDVSKNATLTAPALTKVSGSIYVSENATLTAPALTKVSGSIYVSENATLTAPALTSSGYIDVSKNATLTAPALTKVSGSIYVSKNATLTAPVINIKNNKAKIGNKQYDILFVDNIPFFSENERTSKGIKIYSGFLKIQISENKVIGKNGYLVQKEGFSAHGENLKEAISDLQFKVAAEKIKNEPIYDDTEITVMHYRIITGACDAGCRMFMEKNNIPFKIVNNKTVEESTIKVKDLLPLLKNENAYGYEKFKSLIS